MLTLRAVAMRGTLIIALSSLLKTCLNFPNTHWSPDMGSKQIYALAALMLLVTSGGASPQPVTFEGATFVNKGLVGVTRIPATALDEFGETLGGLGSGMAMDFKKWKKRHDGPIPASSICSPTAGGIRRGPSITAPGCRSSISSSTLSPAPAPPRRTN